MRLSPFWHAAPPASSPLPLPDALPILPLRLARLPELHQGQRRAPERRAASRPADPFLREPAPRLLRSEEHTSELQSPVPLVCRLLLEKKNARTVGRGASSMRGSRTSST